MSEFKRLVKVNTSPSLFDQITQQNRPKRASALANKQEVTFKVFKVNALQANFADKNRYLQALLQFYIEGASFIPVDKFWNYFLVYMDTKLVAYATCFEEYLKVPKAAVTISQVLVLPPYQQHGIGSALL